MLTIEYIRDLEKYYEVEPIPSNYLKTIEDKEDYLTYLKSYETIMPAWCFE
jgi:hypothetical protein